MKPAELIAERQVTHGEFRANAELSQSLKGNLRGCPTWGTLLPFQKEAIDMICLKLSRIMSGKSDVADHWRDIAGYATLVADYLDPPNV